MNKEQFISEIQKRGGVFAGVASDRAIELAQVSLQSMKAAMIPSALIELYKTTGGGAMLSDAQIFGANEWERTNYTIPGVTNINRDFSSAPSMRGRMIWGRNALFLFGADALGYMYMLDPLTLAPMRKYDNPYQAMFDCLVVGKI